MIFLFSIYGNLLEGCRSTDSCPISPQDRTGRISIKLFDRNPGELPQLLRSQVGCYLDHGLALAYGAGGSLPSQPFDS